MLRRHVISAVFRRNFQSYFSSVIGYLFISAFVVIGSFAAFGPEFFSNNLVNLDQLNKYFPLILLFIIPAITMGAWADEKKLGTDELLFTLPATDFEILLGKYLAVLGVYTVVLLFSTANLFVLAWIGKPDWGLIATTYFGYWISGAALLSAGMLASALTSSTTVAFVLGCLICAIPVLIGWVAPNSDFIQSLTIQEQFRDFGMGMIPMSGVLYFVSFTVFMLYLNLVLISRRHWAGRREVAGMGVQFLVRCAALAAILISVNTMLARGSTTIDMTSEHLYTVSPTTKDMIKQLDKDRPVTIQAFISDTVPRDYVPMRTTLMGLLRQYGKLGGSAVRVRIVDVKPFSEQAEEANRYGIEGREVQSEQAGRFTVETIYLGAVITAGLDDEVVIPFFDLGVPVEYELTRSISTVAQEKRLTVGILETDAGVTGRFDMTTFRNSPEWRIVAELKKQYEVIPVSADTDINTEKYDVLVAVLPSSLTEPQMDKLVAYVESGQPVLIFDDPVPAYAPMTAPRLPKPPTGGGMFGQSQEPEPKADDGKATRLMNVLKIAWDSGQIVWDAYNPHPDMEQLLRPEVVFISPNSGTSSAFNRTNDITSGMQEILLFIAGTIRPRAGSNVKFESLLRTGPVSGLLDFDDVMEASPFGNVVLKQQVVRIPDDDAHVIAAHLTEKSDSDAKLNVIFVADSDVISDWSFTVRDRDLYGLRLDNVTFVLNCVDSLAGENSYIQLRKRRAEHRTLEEVEHRKAEFLETRTREQAAADKKAHEQLDARREQFLKQRQQIQDESSLDERTKAQLIEMLRQDEQRKLNVAEAEIQRKKQREILLSKARSERKIRSLENRILTAAVIFPPIPAILLGVFVLSSRLYNERRQIIPDRRVTKL